jgi:hypothetical protein
VNTLDSHCNNINLETISIKGNLVVAELDVSADRFTNDIDFEAHVKQHLSQMLAKNLLESKQIYFSMLKDPNTFRISYKARVCVVPKDLTQEIVKTVKNTPSVRGVTYK